MSLKSFQIANVKAVSKAECTSVPRVMVVAGPNGVGKSTMLYEIAQRRGTVFGPETTVLYQPPHRAIRASRVFRRHTFGGPTISFADLLSRNEVSGFEGMNFPMPARTPDNVDEAGSTIKHSFGKLANRYQTAITDRIAREKSGAATHLALGEIPDIYEPLKTFTDFLLPHLHFAKVDLSDENNVRCLWTRRDKRSEVVLDIDQLSSGEKSLITMFLPMIETEIAALLNLIEPTPAAETVPDIVVIIDEPEQHIHPDLQARVMSYLRKVASARSIQFIVSTHSPTILDQAWDDELYVMVAAGDDVNENQLRKVATNLERLEALRELTGSTFAVTTGRSIICIEGHNSESAEPSDIRILELICPRATAYTFVPVGNKSSVIATVNQLRTNLPAEVFKVNVFGITDLDRGNAAVPGIVSWPVCMIENMLLNSAAVLSAATKLRTTVALDQAAVSTLLAEIALEQRDDEIGLRVSKRLGASTVRPKGATTEAVVANIATQIARYTEMTENRASIETVVNESTAEVDGILQRNEALKAFRGKQILRSLFRKLFPNGNVAYSEFVHAVAAEVEKDVETQANLLALFDRLEQSVVPQAAPAAV